VKVVVLPGLDGTGALLTSFCDALPADLHGEIMSYPVDLWAYDDFADWLLCRLPKDDFLIVAESFSGPLALRLASDPPPGLRGVVCLATFAVCPRWIPKPLLWLGWFWPFGTASLAWLSFPVTMGRWGTRAQMRVFVDVMRGVPMRTMLRRLAAVRDVDVRDLVLAAPTRYIGARHDWLVPAKAALDFEDVTVMDGPHFLLQTQPAQSAELVATFAKGLIPRDVP